MSYNTRRLVNLIPEKGLKKKFIHGNAQVSALPLQNRVASHVEKQIKSIPNQRAPLQFIKVFTF